MYINNYRCSSSLLVATSRISKLGRCVQTMPALISNAFFVSMSFWIRLLCNTAFFGVLFSLTPFLFVLLEPVACRQMEPRSFESAEDVDIVVDDVIDVLGVIEICLAFRIFLALLLQVQLLPTSRCNREIRPHGGNREISSFGPSCFLVPIFSAHCAHVFGTFRVRSVALSMA